MLPALAAAHNALVDYQSTRPATCEDCGADLEDLGAHGVGCPRCADREAREWILLAGDAEAAR